MKPGMGVLAKSSVDQEPQPRESRPARREGVSMSGTRNHSVKPQSKIPRQLIESRSLRMLRLIYPWKPPGKKRARLEECSRRIL